jgi:hypothetical protein
VLYCRAGFACRTGPCGSGTAGGIGSCIVTSVLQVQLAILPENLWSGLALFIMTSSVPYLTRQSVERHCTHHVGIDGETQRNKKIQYATTNKTDTGACISGSQVHTWVLAPAALQDEDFDSLTDFPFHTYNKQTRTRPRREDILSSYIKKFIKN